MKKIILLLVSLSSILRIVIPLWSLGVGFWEQYVGIAVPIVKQTWAAQCNVLRPLDFFPSILPVTISLSRFSLSPLAIWTKNSTNHGSQEYQVSLTLLLQFYFCPPGVVGVLQYPIYVRHCKNRVFLINWCWSQGRQSPLTP